MVARWVNFRWIERFLVVFALIHLGYVVWPTSWWFEPGLVLVQDTYVDEDAEIDFTREIHRDFLGSYSVVVRYAHNREVHCEAESGAFPYEMASSLPHDLDLKWWANSDPDCHAPNLPPSNYVAVTCWFIHAKYFPHMKPKTVCRESTVFEVKKRRTPNV